MNECDFARNLKRWRLRRGITLRELEQRTGLKRHYLLQIERGLHKGTPNQWIRLIKELDVSIEQFASDSIESSRLDKMSQYIDKVPVTSVGVD